MSLSCLFRAIQEQLADELEGRLLLLVRENVSEGRKILPNMRKYVLSFSFEGKLSEL